MEHSLNILAFGQASLFCGGSSFVINAALPITVDELRCLIHKKFPMMPTNYMVAIQLEYASNDQIIGDSNCEIAIIPPVSGG
ncbi:MAG: hypothetical protein RLZZ262_1795 [Bacteroidota bacterium]